MAQTWRLRRGEMDDLDSLHALATIPRVYRYLFDGEPPSREYIAQRLALRISDSPVDCFGLWFLQDGPHHYVDVSSCDPTKSRERPASASLMSGSPLPNSVRSARSSSRAIAALCSSGMLWIYTLRVVSMSAWRS